MVTSRVTPSQNWTATFHCSIYGSHLSQLSPPVVSLLVDIFYWPPTELLPSSSNFPLYLSISAAFAAFPWQFSIATLCFLQRHCVSLYRQCIRRAFRQRLLDNILPSCCCCCWWGLLTRCVFIRQTPVNVPELGRRLSLSPADWVLSLPGQLLFLFLLLLLYLLWVFMHVIERTLLTACQCLIYDRNSGSWVDENITNILIETAKFTS